MPLPALITNTVRVKNIIRPVWKYRRPSPSELEAINAAQADLEARLVPVSPEIAASLVKEAMESIPEGQGPSPSVVLEWQRTTALEFSEACLRASLKRCGGISNLGELTEAMRRYRDYVEIYLSRALKLQGKKPLTWVDIPGGKPPKTSEHKAFDKPVFD